MAVASRSDAGKGQWFLSITVARCHTVETFPVSVSIDLLPWFHFAPQSYPAQVGKKFSLKTFTVLTPIFYQIHFTTSKEFRGLKQPFKKLMGFLTAPKIQLKLHRWDNT